MSFSFSVLLFVFVLPKSNQNCSKTLKDLTTSRYLLDILFRHDCFSSQVRCSDSGQ